MAGGQWGAALFSSGSPARPWLPVCKERLQTACPVLPIFKCLFSKCVPQVPTKKLKKYEREYQTMRESQLQQEDPMDRYKVRAMLRGRCCAGSGSAGGVPRGQGCAWHAPLAGLCRCSRREVERQVELIPFLERALGTLSVFSRSVSVTLCNSEDICK